MSGPIVIQYIFLSQKISVIIKNTICFTVLQFLIRFFSLKKVDNTKSPVKKVTTPFVARDTFFDTVELRFWFIFTCYCVYVLETDYPAKNKSDKQKTNCEKKRCVFKTTVESVQFSHDTSRNSIRRRTLKYFERTTTRSRDLRARSALSPSYG